MRKGTNNVRTPLGRGEKKKGVGMMGAWLDWQRYPKRLKVNPRILTSWMGRKDKVQKVIAWILSRK